MDLIVTDATGKPVASHASYTPRSRRGAAS